MVAEDECFDRLGRGVRIGDAEASFDFFVVAEAEDVNLVAELERELEEWERHLFLVMEFDVWKGEVSIIYSEE